MTDNITDTFLKCGLSAEQQVDLLLEFVTNKNLIQEAQNHTLSKHTPISMEGKILVETQRRVHTISDEYSVYAIPEGDYRERLDTPGFNEYTAFKDIKDSSYNNECIRLSFSAEQENIIQVHEVSLQEI